jgi:hypothetical protein
MSECIDFYDDYILVDNVHVVKKVRIPKRFLPHEEL